MNLKAILFDFDNTLSDRKITMRRFSYSFAENFFNNRSGAEKTKLAEALIAEDRNGYRDKNNMFENLRSICEWNDMPPIAQLMEWWTNNFYRHLSPMFFCRDIITVCKNLGLKVAIVSNGDTILQHKKINASGLEPLCDLCVVSADIGIHKPDKGIFDYASQRLGVENGECIFVGDHPVNDIYGAHNAGMKTVWMEGYCPWEQQVPSPDYTIHSLKELEKIITDEVQKC